MIEVILPVNDQLRLADSSLITTFAADIRKWDDMNRNNQNNQKE